MVDFLLEEIPPGSQVVLVTRVQTLTCPSDPPIASRAMCSRFARSASRSTPTRPATLAASSGARLSERSLAIIRERTEGWPAGIALALRAAAEPAIRRRRRRRPSGDAARDRRLPGRDGPGQRDGGASVLHARDVGSSEDDGAVVRRGSRARPARATCSGTLEQTNSFVIPLDDERRLVPLPPSVRRAPPLRARPAESRACGRLSRARRRVARAARGSTPKRRSVARTNAVISSGREGSLWPPPSASSVAVRSSRCGCGSKTAPTTRSAPIPTLPSPRHGCTCSWARRRPPRGSCSMPSEATSTCRRPTGQPRCDRRLQTSVPRSAPAESTRCSPTPSSCTPSRASNRLAGSPPVAARSVPPTSCSADRRPRSQRSRRR